MNLYSHQPFSSAPIRNIAQALVIHCRDNYNASRKKPREEINYHEPIIDLYPLVLGLAVPSQALLSREHRYPHSNSTSCPLPLRCSQPEGCMHACLHSLPLPLLIAARGQPPTQHHTQTGPPRHPLHPPTRSALCAPYLFHCTCEAALWAQLEAGAGAKRMGPLALTTPHPSAPLTPSNQWKLIPYSFNTIKQAHHSPPKMQLSAWHPSLTVCYGEHH